jgi:hypothetical protein
VALLLPAANSGERGSAHRGAKPKGKGAGEHPRVTSKVRDTTARAEEARNGRSTVTGGA